MASVRGFGVVMLLVLGCGGAGGAEAPAPVPVAPQPAPIATVRKVDREGLETLVKTGSGKPKIVNFWATWCGPCVAEMPVLLAFAAKHPEAEVVMVDMDYMTLTETHVKPFVIEHELRGVDVVQIDDPDPAEAVAWVIPEWTSAIPYTVIVAPDGTPVARHATSIDEAKLERGLELATAPR